MHCVMVAQEKLGGLRGVLVAQESEEIPEDPQLAETHYSQFDDFESSQSEDVSI